GSSTHAAGAQTQPRDLLPEPDSETAGLLGEAGLRDPAALRHGSGRRDIPLGDHAARPGPGAMEGGLCAAVAPADGRALRRKPDRVAALLPVPGDPEAVPGREPGSLSRIARSARD